MGEREPYWTVRIHPTKGLQVWSPFRRHWRLDPDPHKPPSCGDKVLAYEDTKDEPED